MTGAPDASGGLEVRPDTVTIARAPRLWLAKRIWPDRTETYSQARHLDISAVPLDGLGAVASLLGRLIGDPRAAVMRGELIDPARHLGVRRLLYPDRKTGEAPTFRDVPRCWAALDIEGIARPAEVAVTDLVGCTAVAIARLPAAFSTARVVAQATASHGIKPDIRLRLWFWLSRPTSGDELKRWLKGTPSDPAVFSAVAPIYTAAPVFMGGMADPLSCRLAQLPGAAAVTVPPPEALAPPPEPLRSPPGQRAPVSEGVLERFIDRVVDRVRGAPEGQRHVTLRGAAVSLGGIQDRAGFTDAAASRWLLDALGVPGSRAKDEDTIAWGLANGRGRPIEFEPPRHPPQTHHPAPRGAEREAQPSCRRPRKADDNARRNLSRRLDCVPLRIPFDNSYARLPARLFACIDPTPVAAPHLVRLNGSLAASLGIDPEELAGPEGVEVLAGNRIPEGASPIALAYAGHQFGHFVPQLGDGRAILLGEIADRDSVRRDIQLKGSGPTPFSRDGDGRAALGPVLREYLISEAMAAFGVPTTRSLAAVTTGEPVYRETALPGAILTRVASSHIRVGTFQYFATRGDAEALRLLADYAIERHDPASMVANSPYATFLKSVIARHADLVAQWLLIGFIHGVMNTDNTSIAGETIDYGPCAFLDVYDSAAVFSSIDRTGRYAYANQPRIAHWNLTRFAETLLPLLAPETEAAIEIAQEALAVFRPRFEAAYLDGMRAKIGLASARNEDADLIQDLLQRMADGSADFTLTFRRLCDTAGPEGDDGVRAEFTDPSAYDAWALEWRKRLAQEPGDTQSRREAMRRVNPAYIPRNHMVEAALDAAVERLDFGPFEQLLDAVTQPFTERPEHERFAVPPLPSERVQRTFCGT